MSTSDRARTAQTLGTTVGVLHRTLARSTAPMFRGLAELLADAPETEHDDLAGRFLAEYDRAHPTAA